jgi:uncharacterized membrane protein
MSDQETPQDSAPSSEPDPSSAAPPPAQDKPPGEESSNRTLMIVLSSLWILFLVPLLVDKDDPEVQWHAKNGLVLTLAEIMLFVILNIITATGIGCIFAIFIPFVFVGFSVIRIICIIKGIKGERFVVPGISQYADRF